MVITTIILIVAIKCPAGMVYKQCGSLCPQTCDSIGQTCNSGCAEGCFCPDGQFLLNGRCINSTQCSG